MTPRIDDTTYYTLDELYNVKPEQLPMMVISDNLRGVFGLLIKLVTKSFYSHYMELYAPGKMATQWFWYKSLPAKSFKANSLKIFWCPSWTQEQRAAYVQLIEAGLKKGKWATRYDVLGVVGQFLGLDWLQDPKSNYCSEHFCKLALFDQEASEWLKQCPHPTPEEVNAWLKQARNPDGSEKYPVWGRVVPG